MSCSRSDEIRFEEFVGLISALSKEIQRIKATESSHMGLQGADIMILYYLGHSEHGMTGAELARAAGIAPDASKDKHAAEAFIAWVDEMNEQLGIPRFIDGIRAADVPTMAAHAAAESNPLYPVPKLMDANELAEMYRVVAGGEFADEHASAPAPSLNAGAKPAAFATASRA